MLSAKARKQLLADAGGRAAVLANARAFAGWRIVPRMFRGHAVRDLSTTILGSLMPAPVIFALVGRQGLAHPDGILPALALPLPWGSPTSTQRTRVIRWKTSPQATARGRGGTSSTCRTETDRMSASFSVLAPPVTPVWS